MKRYLKLFSAFVLAMAVFALVGCDKTDSLNDDVELTVLSYEMKTDDYHDARVIVYDPSDESVHVCNTIPEQTNVFFDGSDDIPPYATAKKQGNRGYTDVNLHIPAAWVSNGYGSVGSKNEGKANEFDIIAIDDALFSKQLILANRNTGVIDDFYARFGRYTVIPIEENEQPYLVGEKGDKGEWNHVDIYLPQSWIDEGKGVIDIAEPANCDS